jgi:hypothetical protein
MNPANSISVDSLCAVLSGSTYVPDLDHNAVGVSAGVNVGFGHGHALLVSVRANNKKVPKTPFDPNLWLNSVDTDAFRVIMDGFQP